MKNVDVFELLEMGMLSREETQTNEGNWRETKHVYSISPGCEEWGAAKKEGRLEKDYLLNFVKEKV